MQNAWLRSMRIAVTVQLMSHLSHQIALINLSLILSNHSNLFQRFEHLKLTAVCVCVGCGLKLKWYVECQFNTFDSPRLPLDQRQWQSTTSTQPIGLVNWRCNKYNNWISQLFDNNNNRSTKSEIKNFIVAKPSSHVSVSQNSSSWDLRIIQSVNGKGEP